MLSRTTGSSSTTSTEMGTTRALLALGHASSRATAMRSRRIRSEDSRRDVDAVRRAAQQMDKSGVKGPRSGAALGAGRYCASITGDGVARRYIVDAELHSLFPLVPSSRV